jgi:four helix bundle protein
MHNFKELKIWNNAIEISVEIYNLINKFPAIEKYNLSIQMRKNAVSVPSNIAEGAGRNTDKDFLRFLGIAQGSTYELQTQLIISNKLKLIADKDFDSINSSIEELEKMNWGFQKRLKSNV